MLLTANAFNIVGNNVTSGDLQSLNSALSYLERSPTGAATMQQAADGQVGINIVHEGTSWYDEEANTVHWNPNLGVSVLDPIDSSVGVRSPAIALLHETAHANDPNDVAGAMKIDVDGQYGTSIERTAVEKENIVAGDLGEIQRFNHGGWPVATDVTEHTVQNSDGSWSWVQTDQTGQNTVLAPYQPGTYPDIAPSITGRPPGSAGEAA